MSSHLTPFQKLREYHQKLIVLNRWSNSLFQLEKVGGQVSYFETSDENKCNWMMFVRPAESYAEQNMVVFQYGQDLYFTVTKVIEAKTELKVRNIEAFESQIFSLLIERNDSLFCRRIVGCAKLKYSNFKSHGGNCVLKGKNSVCFPKTAI